MGAFTRESDDRRCPSTSGAQRSFREGGGTGQSALPGSATWGNPFKYLTHQGALFGMQEPCHHDHAEASLWHTGGVCTVIGAVRSGWGNVRPGTRVWKSWVGWGYMVNMYTEIKGWALGTSVFWQSKLKRMSVWSLSPVWLFVTPWVAAHQDPLSVGFSRQEYWSGLPFPAPEDLPEPRAEPMSPALRACSLPTEPSGKPQVEENGEKGKSVAPLPLKSR